MDSINSDLNVNAPEFHYKKETRTIQPERFQREERTDLNRRSPTETYVREERQQPPAAWGNQNVNNQYNDILDVSEEPRDRLDSMADSLLDSKDYQELREQEHQWHQKPAPVQFPITAVIDETTPLIQPEVEEQKTYNTEYPTLPPQMAEYDMDNRRQSVNNPAPESWVDSHGVVQEIPPKVEVDALPEYQPLVDLEPEQTARQTIQPLRLRPLLQVARDLCLWRNVKDSAIVFGSGLALMGALSYFSFISIFAYLSLGVLLLTGIAVFGRQLFFALQQRQGPHPFQAVLKRDIVVDPEYLHQQLDTVLQPLNRRLVRMRNLYLADSLAETLKMMFYMYLLTYVGRYFTLMSLMMTAWSVAFSVPKLYVMYRSQIDRAIDMVRVNMRRVQARIGDKFQQQKERIQQRRRASAAKREVTEKKVTFKKTEKVQ